MALRMWAPRLSLSRYVYPKEARPVRDPLRKRNHLVRQHTNHLQWVENLPARNRGRSLRAN